MEVCSKIMALIDQSLVSTRIAGRGYDCELELCCHVGQRRACPLDYQTMEPVPAPKFCKFTDPLEKFAANPQNNEVTQKIQQLMAEVYSMFTESSHSTLGILNATFFSNPSNFRKTVAEDAAKCFGSHLRHAT